MLAFQWNAVRVGDRLMVHDDLDPRFALGEGVVRLVGTRQGANEIAIRLDGPTSGLLRPRSQAVHLMPIDARLPCWRCDAGAATPNGAQRTVPT